MYSEILQSIPDLTKKDECPLTFEECCALHPYLRPESAEAWIFFLSVRPDIAGQDRADIRAIIDKLWCNESHEYQKAVQKWRETKPEDKQE